ncbi:hypothetical protein R1sor_022201 [Riccia sorocarpa]|uniref:Uncharacterized protein n=1 Tax=Riccia sorocarpa TaxID=122646 RepID=A0ABD3GJ62_9MARC
MKGIGLMVPVLVITARLHLQLVLVVHRLIMGGVVGMGAWTSGSGSSGGRTVGVTTGAASGGSTPQIVLPVTTSTPTPSIPAAPAKVGRGSIGGRTLDIATRLAAKYGPISIRHKNAQARVESRQEKNIMVTNPFGHQGFAGFRARFKKAFGIYPLPKHNAFLCAHGIRRVFEFMKEGRDFSRSGGPSSAEVGADNAAGTDDGSAYGAAAVGGNDVGPDDDGAEFSELECSGDELEEDDHGQAPQQERVEEDDEDDKDDEDSSLFEIREALRAPVQPAVSEARHIIRFVVGAESSDPMTVVAQRSVQRAIPMDPQLSTVLQAIALDPLSGVLRMWGSPQDPQPSVARTVIPQPLTVRAVVSEPSSARTTVPEPSSRQTRAQTHPVGARGTEERRAKKSKKSKK